MLLNGYFIGGYLIDEYFLEPLESSGYSLSGVTYDKKGDILSGCSLFLFKLIDGIPVYVASTTSNEMTGAYSFSVSDNHPAYMIVAYKDDDPHVFDVTDHNLIPVKVA